MRSAPAWKKVAPTQWKRPELKRDGDLDTRFAPFPTTDSARWHDTPAFKVAYGASGSDVMFVLNQSGPMRTVKAVVSDAPLKDAPFRTVVPKYHAASATVRMQGVPNFRQHSAMVGDRLPGGELICATRDKPKAGIVWSDEGSDIPGTRVTVEAGRGETRVLAEEVFAGKVNWMRGLMAHADVQGAKPKEVAEYDRLLLFDVGRGKIEVAAEMPRAHTRWHDFNQIAGIAIAPKVALMSCVSTFYLADLGSGTMEKLRTRGESMKVINGTTAGCRAFFSDHSGYPAPGGTAQLVNVRPLEFGEQGGICRVSVACGNGEISRHVNSVFAWSAARGPLAVSITAQSYDSVVRTAVTLVDPRRHVSFQAPGSLIEQEPGATRMRIHHHAPVHVCGQPGIASIASDTSFASYLTL